MIRTIASVIRFLVFTNIFISTCVLCFASKTALLLFGNLGNIHVNLLAFSATLFLYGFHRIYRRYRLFDEEHKEERHHWVDERKSIYYVIIAIAFISATIQMRYMPFRVWLLLVPIGGIALGYSIPFIKTVNGYIRLRDISWLKAFWIALAYAWLTTFLPVVYYYSLSNLLNMRVLLLFIENFIFIFVLAVPFDIRDMQYDIRNKVNTLPILLGIRGAINLCLFLLFLFAIICFLHIHYFGSGPAIFIVLFISAAETAFFTTFSKPERPNLFFPLAIESSMILQWLLLLIAVHLS